GGPGEPPGQSVEPGGPRDRRRFLGHARPVHLIMPLQFEELWNLQQLDTEIYRLKRERSRLDDGAALRQSFEAAARAVEALETRLRKLRADLADAELELKRIEGKKADFERRLYEGKTTNPKELTAMEQEIAMLGRQRGRPPRRQHLQRLPYAPGIWVRPQDPGRPELHLLRELHALPGPGGGQMR